MARDPGIPKFTIDLSRSPEERYDHVVPQFREYVTSTNLTGLFHEVVDHLAGKAVGKCLGYASQVAMRHLHGAEETAEIHGLSRQLGIPLHIMIAFNSLLDLLLGCTSGAARAVVDDDKKKTRTEKQGGLKQSTRLLHFRTLDWGMDQLRNIVVELDFVRSAGGPVVATSITYLGYVGCLTGVRRGLSMSLNFRPYHARETWMQAAAFRWHQAMVVLGMRPSISSVMRHYLLRPGTDDDDRGEEGVTEKEVEDIMQELTASHSTSAYLIFCTAQRVFVVEKDNGWANIRSSDKYLVACNHDAEDELDPSRLERTAEEMATVGEGMIGMAELVGYSIDRKDHMDKLWKRRLGRRRSARLKGLGEVVTQTDVVKMISDAEISNEETHYAAVMDPGTGRVVWRSSYAALDVEGLEQEEGGP
ncbi:hypothetical protein N3K66_007923 [Trichothecium roseum]|uniref:Uncharacterized protein n=1 Tax=Trichothecium roseum TaxID=47278 RepID=A0ACC0US45_9HYPO|nr:hypothetical protein N3K66_007923 [Trichothecium roseum]